LKQVSPQTLSVSVCVVCSVVSPYLSFRMDLMPQISTLTG